MILKKTAKAVDIAVFITSRSAVNPVTTEEIASGLGLSSSYTESILKELREAGLIRAHRGPGGGYTLNRDASHISVADIIRAVSSLDEKEQASGEAQQTGYVSTDELWSQLNQKIEDHMQSISLQSLVTAELSKTGPVHTPHSAKRGVFARKPQAMPVNAQVPNSVFALGNLLANGH